MALCVAPVARLARGVAWRGLHSGRVLLAEPPAGKADAGTQAKSSNSSTPSNISGGVPGSAPDSAPSSAPGGIPGSAPGGIPGSTPGGTPGNSPGSAPEEKIEYFGNTRFPKPRPKPRRTITPGDAVGQDTPAVKAERQPLRQQMEQKMRDVLSPEKNLESRAKIIHDIGHSYWQDHMDLRNNGDKLFEAPPQLIDASRAKYLPGLTGRTLGRQASDITDLCRGKTTLLSVDFTKFAEKHTRSFTSVFERECEGRDDMQVVFANVEENLAKAVVLALCLPFVRRAVPKKHHKNYLLHYGAVEPFRKALGIANPLIGYVFLVDASMRVRWYANGLATESEATTMVRLAQNLASKAKKAKKADQ
ncbi:Mitochondrial ATPase complex subunit atp10 [Coemansia biformis]|uniref:Mitochondrial ATPase complex subunit atp10 n=1 Tax=Coemansia biformis TaxID=1286918 RepID=A0A9W8CX54_9FUNG|nr:Mitochondrial ATPase complex subunit atp10 [Coemansia biformis]